MLLMCVQSRRRFRVFPAFLECSADLFQSTGEYTEVLNIMLGAEQMYAVASSIIDFSTDWCKPTFP